MQRIFISVLLLLLIGISGYYYLEIHLPDKYAKEMISLFDEMKSSDQILGSSDIKKDISYADALKIIQDRQTFLIGAHRKLTLLTPPRKMATIHNDFLELLQGFLDSNANSVRKALFFKDASDIIAISQSDIIKPENKNKTVSVGEYQTAYNNQLSEIKSGAEEMFKGQPIDFKAVSYNELKLSWIDASRGYNELSNYLGTLDKNTRIDPTQPLKVVKSSNTENISNIDRFISILKAAVNENDVKEMVTNFLIFPVWFSMLMKIFFQESIRNNNIDIFILFAIGIVAIFLIKSFLTEVKQKELLDWANSQLKDLSEHLQQKVDEQTKEIRRAYEVEKKARFELEELDKAKTQFILTAQHHLRTPLTILKGYAALLKEKFGNVEEAKAIIDKIAESTERLRILVNEFLDVSELEVGKNLHFESANIKDLIVNIIKISQPEIDKKHLEVTLASPAKMEDNFLTVDKERINNALMKIIDNAVRYNKEGGKIKIQLQRISHPIEKGRSLMRISVEDTGIGIPPDELAKLFIHYFQRGEEAQKIYTTGRGMGLATAKSIIQAHHGNIWAESEGHEKGAMFVIEIPDNDAPPVQIRPQFKNG